MTRGSAAIASPCGWPKPAKGKPDPCALLTKGDAEAVMGETAKEGERPAIPTNSLGLAICFHGAAADRSFASTQIAVVQNDTIDARARKNGVSARQTPCSRWRAWATTRS